MRALAVMLAFAVGFAPLKSLAGGDWCADSTAAKKQLAQLGITLKAPAAFTQPHYSSFKGLSLDLTPGEAAATLLAEGFDIWINTYVSPPDRIASYEICRSHGQVPVGWVNFDQGGKARRLTLHAEYFFDKEITVRDFADRVFKYYGVHRDEVSDDACFQDVTCFRGRTDAREQFLILKIGGQVQLYVRQLKPNE
jgi:hypothetical protein